MISSAMAGWVIRSLRGWWRWNLLPFADTMDDLDTIWEPFLVDESDPA